ncbi:outer membrane protein assembly factor BamB family protein [Halorussus halobius]|uniref:outer membrane protein assembly factor BamB family protein n=1 Tax=Halorussus halobius TaxID=1710537 RepID=UPI00109259E5|nr:PQQ-binding-like beta-propeller repeat protein [Halorussus halobius]
MSRDADVDSSRLRRRGALAALGSLAASGCLRLTANEEAATTASETGASEPATTDGEAGASETATTSSETTETTTEWDVELNPQWSRHLAPSEHVLDGDALYVADRDQNSDLGLLAVDVADGSRRWTVSAPYRTRSLALTDDGTLYAGVGQLTETDGSLYAVDAESGSAEVAFDADQSPTRGSPLTTSDVVVFGTRFHEDGEDRLYGLSRDGHDVRWSASVEDGSYTGGVIADDTAYVGGFDYRFGALDPATGEWAWRDDWQLAPDTDPVVRDGSVFFVDADEGLVRLAPDTGAEEWRHAAERDTNVLSHVSGPTFDGERVYFTMGSTVHAAAVGGDGLWSVDLPNPVRYSPAVVGGVVWVATQDSDVLHGLDAETGETAFRTQLPANTERTAAAGDRLLAFLDDRVLAFTTSRP